jgi:hypothetical protein
LTLLGNFEIYRARGVFLAVFIFKISFDPEEKVRHLFRLSRFKPPKGGTQVASLVAYVATPLSSATTGTAPRVDGWRDGEVGVPEHVMGLRP